ncbi:MAG TPA: hypothetical protein ENN41_09315 [Sediminispirochaeta sp.]|nr:hypothetical protein [Sediminispirochaeta sp.]
MSTFSNTVAWPVNPARVSLKSVSGAITELVLIGLAIGLPIIAHALAWPVFALLPMHWTILLAGLVYGWKGGLLAGFSAPLISFAVTGMPMPFVLPMIVVEVSLYGAVSGLFSRKNAFFGLFAALIVGRVGFAATALLLGRVQGPLMGFIKNSFTAGVPAAFAQLLILPFIAGMVVSIMNKE